MEFFDRGYTIAPPDPELRLSVILPAKDEADNIEETLRTLYDQVSPSGCPVNRSWYEVILLANNCSDNTAAIAKGFADNHPDLRLHIIEDHLTGDQAHIGYVRRLLMDLACKRMNTLGKNRGVIASTDADTQAGDQWVWGNLAAIQAGADAVGGRILTRPHKSDYRKYHLLDVRYRFLQSQLEALIDPDPYDAWPRHFQNFGPSMAVTSEMYQRAGGMPVVPYLEDVRFYEALRSHDARIRHCPKVRVVTSSRTCGRVEFGFSIQLERWANMSRDNKPIMVQGCEEIRFRAHLTRLLRQVWQSRSKNLMVMVARQINAPVHRLRTIVVSSAYFGAFLHTVMHSEQVTAFLSGKFKPVPIHQAIRELQAFIAVAVKQVS